jgi:hypothetical protein
MKCLPNKKVRDCESEGERERENERGRERERKRKGKRRGGGEFLRLIRSAPQMSAAQLMTGSVPFESGSQKDTIFSRSVSS